MQNFFLLWALSLTLQSCTNTQGYGGPERPASETAKVFFYSQKPLELSEMSVDGKSKGVFDLGVVLLPGNHYASARFELTSDLGCDYYGCATKTYNGNCQTDMRLSAGKSYAIRVTGVSDTAFMRVEEEESKEVVGSGSCFTTGATTDIKPHPRK